MRQKGNLRLLMNANLWAEMQVSKMEGGKVRRAPVHLRFSAQDGILLCCLYVQGLQGCGLALQQALFHL